MLFKRLGTAIAERLMQALPVIETLNIVKDCLTSFRAILERAMMRQLVLERTEKAFYHGIVITTPLATETQLHAMACEHRVIESRRILVPLVTVM